jgi:GGDEF domain-containing protein
VELHHSAEILEHLGAMRLYLMLDEFALRLNEKLRDSDVITRIEESCLLLLLPFTSPEGLKARIEQIFAQMASEDGDVCKLRLVIRTYEGEPSEKATALGMMQKMAKLYSAEAAAK